MTVSLKETATYTSGPYKGYHGHAVYDGEAGVFHGEVLGTTDVITFQGQTVEELRTAFRESVDDYLKFCKARGESPQKPFSGKFVVRLTPENHRKLASIAKTRDKSLNSVVSEFLERAVQELEATAGETPKAPRRREKNSRT
ncbi:MAG: type II toxin-antitoxin system HicB family antitoxin [Planctomycetaceae bacterium]|nr:type II toxin-antitoxin system HicB family antitoxin [Planctomycetaceae bacterium]